MDIFLNKLIQFYLNDTTDLRHLTQRIVSCYTVPTKWRSCRDHRLCDVTSFCVWRLVHSTVHDPVTRRVDWSRTTWLAAVKLGQLVLSHFTALWTVPLEYTCLQLQGGNYQICSGGSESPQPMTRHNSTAFQNRISDCRAHETASFSHHYQYFLLFGIN